MRINRSEAFAQAELKAGRRTVARKLPEPTRSFPVVAIVLRVVAALVVILAVAEFVLQ